MEQLKIIIDNPFRVLGAYSNARQMDIVKNQNKIKAYLNVGKSVEFPMDMSLILPDVDRNPDSVLSSQKSINLFDDKIKYGLFWFCNVTSVDDIALNHLIAGNIDKAVELFLKRSDFSSLINSAVISVIRGDIRTALQRYVELLNDNGKRDSFVHAICDDTFDETGEELIKIIIEELSKIESSVNLLEYCDIPEYRLLIKDKALKEPISALNNAIAKAKSCGTNDPQGNLKAGKILMNSTKGHLKTLKTIVGKNDHVYQSSADNLAKQILQCGINYFNNSNDCTEIKIENAFLLQEYAYKIAEGKLTKDRCEQNLDILLSQKKQSTVDGDVKAVMSILNCSKTKYKSLYNAREIVYNARPHLLNICTALGKTNELYLQISSAVANVSLSMIISVINGDNSKSQAKTALEIIEIIEELDVDHATSRRISTNKEILKSNIAKMPTGFEKVDNATGGCLSTILAYAFVPLIILLIIGIISLFD